MSVFILQISAIYCPNKVHTEQILVKQHAFTSIAFKILLRSTHFLINHGNKFHMLAIFFNYRQIHVLVIDAINL